MQSFARILLIGATGLALAAPAASQRADDQIMPKSLELQRHAREAIAAGKLEQAEDLLETALAVDPRNRSAFVDIARVAEKQHLFGKAIRMTNKALLLEPNDPDASRPCCLSRTTPTPSRFKVKRWWKWALRPAPRRTCRSFRRSAARRVARKSLSFRAPSAVVPRSPQPRRRQAPSRTRR